MQYKYIANILSIMFLMVTTTTFSIHAYRNQKKENSLDTMSAKGQDQVVIISLCINFKDITVDS